MPARDVAIVIHEGVQALDVAGPLDVFAEANGLVRRGDRYRCFIVAESKVPMRTSSGMMLTAHLDLSEAERKFHTVLVAGGPDLPKQPPNAVVSDWLRRWGTRAKRFGSVCTGAFALADAGLLDGKIVTTHWQNAAQLAVQYPAARVEHDRIYSRDGKLITSAGVTAGIDLALALVSEDHGAAISLACAKRLVVVTQRQGGQSQFSPLLLPPYDVTTPVGRVQAYVVANLAEPLPVERLARIAGTSARTIARKFVRDLGVTPHDFVEGVRLEQARNLLEATDLALKSISYECGFASPEHMRGAFKRRFGFSPLRYRENFRAV